jgi:hypothetical protein
VITHVWPDILNAVEPVPLPPLFLLVQLVDQQTVKAESFNGFYVPNPTAFTAAARTYIR